MVSQVSELDEKIKHLTEEMGCDASVDEVAQFMEMSRRQIKKATCTDQLREKKAPEDEESEEA